MAFVRPKARILERTITAGSGPYALSSVDASYNRFSSFMAIGDTTYVSVVEPGVAFWTGIATYSAANQITLTTVEETTGTFGAGTKEIMSGPLASTSVFREDISGAIVTAGTSTAYTVASYRKYDSLTRLDGNIIAFSPHATNGQTVTLNVDSLGAKPLRQAPGTDLMPGVLIQGTPYLALYSNVDQVFYLHGFFGNPYNVPLLAGLDYWDTVTPNSAFIFPMGQAISRVAYPAAFARWGITYGPGDGSTTFNVPDKTGRVSAMKESVATRLTSAISGIDGSTMGAAGGSQSRTLSANQVPSLTSTNGAQAISVTSTVSGVPSGIDNGLWLAYNGTSYGSYAPGRQGAGGPVPFGQITSTGNNSISVSYTNSSQVPVVTAQPSIICNYIIRIA